MYILEPEGGFVSNINYIEKEKLNISELRSINNADASNTSELFSDNHQEYERNKIKRDRLIFDDSEYDQEYELTENKETESKFNEAFEHERNTVKTRLMENNFKGFDKNNRTGYGNYQDINNHGILRTNRDDKRYSIKSIYDSIANNRNDSLYYDKTEGSKYDKCNGKDCYGDEEYAENQNECMKDKLMYEDCEEHKPIIEDTDTECYGNKCEDKVETPVVEDIEEMIPEEPEEEEKEEICEEDFDIIQGQIKAEIEYNFSLIGQFIKKLTPNQVCDLHICLFKEALNNKMLSGADDFLEIAVNKFKQMYDFQNNALSNMKSNIAKASQITKQQIEYKAKEILNMLNSFTAKLEELFRKLTLKQLIIIRKLIITVSMDCYLDKIVGAADNIEKGMSSKVNMYLNWLRRIIEGRLDSLCNKCNKSYYMKNERLL